MNPIWFDGVCDTLLAKVRIWYERYEKGQVRGTRPFLNTDGKLEDRPVKFLHEIPITQKEAEALLRIMTAKRPKLPLTEMLAPLVRTLRRYPMRMHGTVASWVIPFAYYKPEVREILKTIEEAQAEAKNTTVGPTVDQFVAEKKKQGGHLWNIG
jgi:hypothetical protein